MTTSRCRICDDRDSSPGRRICTKCTAQRRKQRIQEDPTIRATARAAQRRYREANREKVRETNRQSAERQKARDPKGYAEMQRRASKTTRDERRALIQAAKDQPCLDCGKRWPPAAMDLHHRDPAEKEYTPSQMVNKAISVIEAEIAKCDVLCACCHRLRHAA